MIHATSVLALSLLSVMTMASCATEPCKCVRPISELYEREGIPLKSVAAVHHNERTQSVSDLDAFQGSLSDHEGTYIKITGLAYNSKLSAMIESSHGVIYCIDVAHWAPNLLGKSLEVTGLLRRTDAFKMRMSPTGEVSQGTTGGDWILKGVRHHLVTVD